jgi:DNA-directed RNA polymerase sigma subunit (sigma70/sigma32)
MDDKEKEFIRIFYPSYGSHWVSAQLSIPHTRIIRYARKIGLYRDEYCMSFGDIGKILGIDEKEARNIMSKAFRKLKKNDVMKSICLEEVF